MRPMLFPRPTISPRRRLVWLLWLVLLLPLAQTAASLHLLSHAIADVSGASAPADGKQAIEHAHCELCLTAAALVGAAPPVAPPLLPQLVTHRQQPATVHAAVWLTPTITAYESRAPPFSLL